MGLGLAVRTDPGNAKPPQPGSLSELKCDGAGCYMVIDCKQETSSCCWSRRLRNAGASRGPSSCSSMKRWQTENTAPRCLAAAALAISLVVGWAFELWAESRMPAVGTLSPAALKQLGDTI